MKDRKRIAVLMNGVSYKAYSHPVLEGILSQAFALNYDVAVFSPFMSHDNQTDYQLGENRIFDLVNFDMFDAVIYVPCSFYTDVVREPLEKLIQERCHIPVVALESDKPEYHCIMMDDEQAFECMTDHLIEVHGLTKIACLTGFKDNLQAEARLQGYKTSMKKHGLEIPEEFVIYGDFWKFKAVEVADQIADGTLSKPEAIVCCGDMVAVTLCNRLVEHGFRVPEDIVITGYDATPEAEDNVPSVTTYVRPIIGMAVEGVLKVHELLTGVREAPVIMDHGHLVPAESCGCGKDFQQKFAERQKEIKNFDDYRNIFDNTPMAECLNATTTLNDLLQQIMGHFYLINGLTDWYLCLCDQWDDLSRNTDNKDDYNHYTDTMHLRITCTDQRGRLVDETFPKEQLLPALHADREKPRAYYFTPLHFNDRCLGYTALGFGDKIMAFDSVYHSWSRHVNNALEFIRIRNICDVMNQRLFLNSIRDTLTGIYNRKGFLHFAEEIFQKAKDSAPEKKLLVLAADLDCLKEINDNYGHLEGDNAITTVANALNTSIRHGEISARTGGDEFLVIGCADYTEHALEKYIASVQRFLERYNADSGKPYEVGASVGYVCEAVLPEDTLQQFIDEADARMYANKTLRKKNRR